MKNLKIDKEMKSIILYKSKMLFKVVCNNYNIILSRKVLKMYYFMVIIFIWIIVVNIKKIGILV